MSSPLCYLVFYDGNCGLCDHIVQFLLREDQKQVFVFAPLQGKTANHYLNQLPSHIRLTDSLILVENYRSPHPRVFILAKAALRICWILGGVWKFIGWFSFFPSWMFDWGYRLIARNRHRFFKKIQCQIPVSDQKDRFLP